MDAKGWRTYGFFTLFRDARDGFADRTVILVDKTTGSACSAPVNKGAWMNLALDEFEPAVLTPKMKDALRSCYCDSGCGTCDFCSGVRSDFVMDPRWKKPLPWEGKAA